MNGDNRTPNFNMKKLKEKATRLETTKDGVIILDKNNPRHVAFYEDN